MHEEDKGGRASSKKSGNNMNTSHIIAHYIAINGMLVRIVISVGFYRGSIYTKYK